MQFREWKIRFSLFDSLSQLPEDDQALCHAATEALDKSYAPYSRYQVGAALRLSQGKVFSGANQENAAYPMCLCAERVTMAAAQSAHPGCTIEAMAIAVQRVLGLDHPAMPCGACRQVIVEQEGRQGSPMAILLMGKQGEVWKFDHGSHLLPFPFTDSFF